MTFSCRNVLQCKPFGSAHLVSLWPTIAMVFQKIKINIFLIYPYSIFHILHFIFYSIYTLYSTITLYIPHFTPQFTLHIQHFTIPHIQTKFQILQSSHTLHSVLQNPDIRLQIPHFILHILYITHFYTALYT